MGGLRRSEAVELKWRDVTDAREEGGLHEARTAHGRIISGIVNRSRPASSTPPSGRLGLCAEPEALWTRAMVRELIERQYGVTLSLASVGRLLRSLGLTPQRPVRRATEQVAWRVREWLTVEFPAIRAQALAAGAQIFFADEAGVRSQSHAGTTWALRGQTPVVPATGKRFGLNLVSAVSPRGVLRFMVVDGRMTAVRFIEFLKRLLHNQTCPIYLIVDQHSTHRARAVQDFVQSTNGRLRLFFLPPYSPELNPDEPGGGPGRAPAVEPPRKTDGPGSS